MPTIEEDGEQAVLLYASKAERLVHYVQSVRVLGLLHAVFWRGHVHLKRNKL
ncbi:hypothetical protein BSD967_09245 [Bifidobacterium saguini]|uniref:Uncharacterized protein n=1 Tax=Bifidobacterium saguini TaxID=762210 RepID=A0ABX7SCF7_9BIFI|nr:hypothetical protein [Bifidobacterium saguini]QTB90495.1 hypothetical protein BSD967_09245 [Bifidobacterium saguini]